MEVYNDNASKPEIKNPKYIYKIKTAQKNIYDSITVVETDTSIFQSEYSIEDKHQTESWAYYITVGGENIFGIDITRPEI